MGKKLDGPRVKLAPGVSEKPDGDGLGEADDWMGKKFDAGAVDSTTGRRFDGAAVPTT